MCNKVQLGNIYFTSLNWAMMPRKQSKPFVVWKVKLQLIVVEQPDGSRKFAQVTRTLTIRQGQVDLEALIPRLCSKPQRQTQRVSREYLKVCRVCHLHNLCKHIRNSWIVPLIAKILQNFWLTKVYILVVAEKFLNQSRREWISCYSVYLYCITTHPKYDFLSVF